MAIVYDEDDGPKSTSAQCGGTTPFMAPELLSPGMFNKTSCRVSKEADAYAFGMVVLQVCLYHLTYLIELAEPQNLGVDWIDSFSSSPGRGDLVQGHPR